MKTLITCALFFCAVNCSTAANWVYTEYFPWVWDSDNDWTYLPESSEKVWSSKSQSWVPNPYGTPVDLSAFQSDTRWVVELSFGDGVSWTLVLFKPGVVNDSFMTFGDRVYDTYAVNHTSIVDETNGTVLIYVESDTDRMVANFSVLLDFETDTAGDFQMVGTLQGSTVFGTILKNKRGTFESK